MLRMDQSACNKKFSGTNTHSTMPWQKQTAHGMVDEHSSTPFSKQFSLKSSGSMSGRKSTNILIDRDLGEYSRKQGFFERFKW